MKIINCRKIADNILIKLKQEIQKKDIKSRLAVILVGDDPVSRLYVKIKEKTGQSVGIEVEKHFLSDKIKEKEIIDLIHSLNRDNRINGILVQLPLPQGLSTDRIIKEISIEKDLDGFLLESRFNSPFILAIYEAIKATKANLGDKKIVALVNSNVFGERLKSELGAKYTVLNNVKDLLDSSSLAFKMTKQADILITALGQPEIIKGDMIKKDAVLIDGGITKIKNKIMGDIDTKSVKNKAKWLSPVPGGLGPLTVAFLMKNIVKSS